MKTKLTKIFGIGFALVLVASMMVFALPAAADPYAPLTPALPNLSQGFPPTPGITGGYFFDPLITKIGPIAEAIDGDLYAYVANASAPAAANDIFKSVDGGRSWYPSIVPGNYASIDTDDIVALVQPPGPVVDMVCSSVSEDVLYVTDGNYVYKSINGGATFLMVAQDSLETALTGNCGVTVNITGLPITCIDLTYDGAGKPIVFIGTRDVGVLNTYVTPNVYIVGSVYWIADETFPAAWADLKLSCYGCCTNATSPLGCFDVFSIGAAPDFATSNKAYALISKPTTLSFALASNAVVTVTNPSATTSATITFTALPAGVVYASAGTDTSPDTLAPSEVVTFTATALAAAGKVDVSVVNGQLPSTNWVLTGGIAGDSICAASTQVVSTVGTVCSWTLVAQLYWNCDSITPNNFEIREASRFAFGDDFASTRGMFIGVAGTMGTAIYGPGGDVYFVADTIPTQPALDLNVQGYVSGCLGLAHANINSLDMCGATDSGSLVAGALDGYQAMSGDNINTNVWYSNDGGWSWAPSAKDPTGLNTVYVIFYNDCATALAATNGCSCAISMSCGETVGQYFNQIALIDTNIAQVWDMSHAPGYVTDSTTMYVLTFDNNTCGTEGQSTDLFRWDGTYWERVYSSQNWEYHTLTTSYGRMEWVEVSPDFNDTGCLYLANSYFQMFRSVDEGCSWRILSYPCAPLPHISAWIVVDEETVLAAGSPLSAPTAEFIYKTDRHGTRPWSAVPVYLNTGAQSANDGVDFDLSPSIATDNNVLFSDEAGHVYLSKDLAATPFNEISNVVTLTSFLVGAPNESAAVGNTYCVFDPGYGTAGDPGETMIYAAALNIVGRCALNSASPLAKQSWVYISTTGASCDPFAMLLASGIGAVGDTALYVSDAGGGVTSSTHVLSGTMEVSYATSNYCDLDLAGSTVTAISGWPCSEALLTITYDLKVDEIVATFPGAGTATVTAGAAGATFTYTVTGGVTGATASPVTLAAAGTFVFTAASAGTADILVTSGSATIALTTGTPTFAYYINGTAVIQGVTSAYTARVTVHEPTCLAPVTVGPAEIVQVISSDLTLTCSSTTAGATGIWRTLNPMDLMPPTFAYPLVEWEFLPSTAVRFLHREIGLVEDFNVNSDDLWITQASNMLWTLEQNAQSNPTAYIWMWEDPLAAPVILLTPANEELLATSTSATISWNALDGALYYQYMIFTYCPTCPDNMLVFTPPNTTTDLTCIVITGLTPGTTYFWKVRVACDSPYVSKWSELRAFDTALSSTTNLCSPICGASDIVLTTNYSWDAVLGATGYELQVVAASADGTVDWTGATTYNSTTNAFASIPGLQYSTVYYWRVRAANDGVYSAWSECIFTTMTEPVAPVEPGPPVVIEENEITPTWIWVIIGIGGALTIAVVILIVTTRRVP